MMIKRIFDIVASLISLLVLTPVMLVEAILIRLDSPGPIFFKQKRVGKNGNIFFMYKFRTMVEGAQKLGPAVTAYEDPRITQIGRILRQLKIDEIPQFFNVLKGEMSIVGPRPEVPEIVEKYPEEFKKIFDVKPGIIGMNQISHFDEEALLKGQEDAEAFYLKTILPVKLRTDLAYAQNKNPYKDLQLLFGGTSAIFINALKVRYIFESRRRILFLLVDCVLAAVSFWAAYALRFENEIPLNEKNMLASLLPIMICLRVPAFVYFGLYQTLWQYLGIQELLSILKAVTAGSLLLPFVPFFVQMDGLPRTVLIIDWIVLAMLLGGSRVFFKLTADRLRVTQLDKRKNVLIVGAEDAGEMLIREYIKRPNLGYRPVAFVDDHPEKIGMRIHGIKVMGSLTQIGAIAKIKKVDEIVIAMAESTPEQIKIVMQVAREMKVPCRIIPSTSAMMAPGVLPLKLRPVDVSDLLGRELVQADQAGIRDFVNDKKVLVTGAGGSIGSELTRILHQNHPRELILVDYSENNLYDIQMDLKARASETQVYCYLRDITNREDMEAIFEKHQPQVVYHAAAYKHVPLVEHHYAKGILNNILGTRTVADLAQEYRSESFVMISTDKAINPTSMMGVTKRISELYVQNLAEKKSKTRFISVRFGNVFGSRGSVVPLFKKQIEEGGPVTVTDPRMTRYFMDVSEAVFLILQAAILGDDSEIFVLDMGEPIKIMDLAKNLIQMSGAPLGAIEIKITGLRPGEKLAEELELNSELSIPTKHPKIKIWRSSQKPLRDVSEQIDDLLEMVSSGVSREAVIQKIQSMVPEYKPYLTYV